VRARREQKTGAGRIAHGGDAGAAERRFGRPKGGWLDLSTGINPHAFPLPRPAAQAAKTKDRTRSSPPGLSILTPSRLGDETWRRLPDRKAIAALARAAADCYGVTDPSLVVPAPGTQALIQWLPRLCPPGTVAVVGPTYAEHARCWRLAGHRVKNVADLAVARASKARVVIAVNPNNPDGRRFAPKTLRALARALARRKGLLVVDESFADVAKDVSLAAFAGRPGLVVLRSFGKFFGLAGIRLGFALAPAPLAATLGDALGPWAVSGPAAAIGTAALRDRRWQARTRRRLAGDMKRLRALLQRNGLDIVGGTDLFVLTAHPKAGKLWEQLARRGILVRKFAGHARRLRFGLPERPREWRRLAHALAEFSARGLVR
jgi:cobalamin biosynthetic protein CobC